MVKLLVEAGANPTMADNEGRTPMDLAKSRDYQECITILQVSTVLWPHLHLSATRASQATDMALAPIMLTT